MWAAALWNTVCSSLHQKMQAGEAAPCQLAEYSASAKEDDAALAACGGSMNVFLQLLKEEENNEA